MSCKNCGYENKNGAKFCAKCGCKINAETKGNKSSQNIIKVTGMLVVIALAIIGLIKIIPSKNTPPFIDPTETVAETLLVLEPIEETTIPQVTEKETLPTTVPTTAPATVPTTSPTENTEEKLQNSTNRGWKNNVLMKDRASQTIPLGGFKSSIVMNTVLGSDLCRDQICCVEFESTLESVPDDCWDASEKKNNSVLAWTIPCHGKCYKLYVAANGGINGKIACEDLFCGYINLVQIDFNGSFHTEETEDFSRMFYGCWDLEEINLSGIKTDSAINLSEMFANCDSLLSLDVSGFDTSFVEDTSGMFSGCRELQSVDITGFDLYKVRDISFMFFGCPAGNNLQVVPDGVQFRNVDRYENFLDKDVVVNGEPWINLFEFGNIYEEVNIPDPPAKDIVVFGKYEQDNIKSNGPEQIEWYVMDEQEDKVLLLSRYALDSQPYNKATTTVTWENCSLRKWLNDEFLHAAFTEEEQKEILTVEVDNGPSQSNAEWNVDGGENTYDSIFLLSYEETNLYFDNHPSRICAPTSYAVSEGADIRKLEDNVTDAGWWWLRSPGEKGNHASFVNYDGTRYTNMVSNGYLSVRPAIWVDRDALSSFMR